MSFLVETNTDTTGVAKTTLSTLARLYENVFQNEVQNGRYMDVRPVPTNDIPVLSCSSTTPSTDSDPASKIYSLCGRTDVISGNAEITAPYEINSISSWVSGFNKGLRCQWYSNMYRLATASSSYLQDAASGNQDNNLTPPMKIDSNGVYSDIILDGDVLFIVATNSSRFCFWVNDRLISTAVTPAGTGLTADSSGQQYTPTTAGRQYFKIKFPTIDIRTIRIYHYGAGGIGDYYSRITQNVYPRHRKKINWLHISDAFGTTSGALNQLQTIPNHLSNSFGTSVNFINASVISTGLDTTIGSSVPNWLQRWDTDLKLNEKMDVVTIFGSYADGGKTNVTSNLTSLIEKIKSEWSDCVVFVSNTVTAAQVAGNTDITDERTLLNAAEKAGAVILRTQTDPIGRWLTGSGREGSPAGNGNADVLVSSGGTVPSNKGHVFWGRKWAAAMYEAMRKEIGI